MPHFPFVTNDAKLASALIIKGFRLQNYCYPPSGKANFTFHGAESLRHTIELYWDDKLSLNARTLLSKYEGITKKLNDQCR